MNIIEAAVVRKAVSVAAGIPVVLWGSSGTGKTSVVRALGRSLGCPVEVVIGSLREPSDFAGLPVVAAFLKVRPTLVLQLPKVAASAGRGWPSPRGARTVARRDHCAHRRPHAVADRAAAGRNPSTG